jgi:hypothetical protein
MTIFPADVKASQVIAFVKSVHAADGVAHVHKIASDMRMDLTTLLPVLDAAEMLGLVVIEKGEAKLLREGEAMIGTKKGRIFAISRSLAKIEPFMTALTFKKRFNGEELAKELSEKGIRWHHEDEINCLIVNEMLVHWGIGAGLVDFDGSEFTPKSLSAASS